MCVCVGGYFLSRKKGSACKRLMYLHQTILHTIKKIPKKNLSRATQDMSELGNRA